MAEKRDTNGSQGYGDNLETAWKSAGHWHDKCAEACDDRNHWVRLFNRLEGAVSHHRKAKAEGAWNDDADDALHAAHDWVLKAAARRS